MVLGAVLALSLVAAASAAAEVALWLENGSDIVVLTLVSGSQSWNFTNRSILGNVTVHCSDIVDGLVGPEGEDEITELLSLNGVLIPEALGTGNGLNCNVSSGSSPCATNELAEVWPMNLPWHTQLLLEGEGYKDELGTGSTNGKEPGYHIFCPVTKAENLCEAILFAVVRNGTSGVESEYVKQPTRICTVGTGEFDSGGVASTISLSTGTLTVSMP